MWPRLCFVLMLSMVPSGEAGAYTAYVSNERSNTVSVIDTNKWEVVKTIKVGQRPRGIAHTKDQKYVLVAVGDDDTIQMIDTGTNQVVGTLPSGTDPELFVEVSRRQDALRRQRGQQYRHDHRYPEPSQVGDIQVGVEPEGMGISPDGKVLVNTSETTNMAHFIDTATPRDRGQRARGCAAAVCTFKQDGSELWVSSEVGGTVSVIDPVKHAVRQKIEFKITGMRPEPIQPVGINITRDGKTGFVALGPANHVAVVDGVTHQVIKYLLVGQRVWHMAFTPDEKYLLTTNGVSNDVSVIDVASLKVINTIQVGQLPWGITMSQQ